ncbi:MULTISPECIES: beta-galactosidase [Metabacillus]|uniref:Beta-galactosidase n=2 Tax=Metabacillus TaxID=2675233 RepID=A0A179SM96_9BACI|nr:MULTISPECIES: beta-galactosidase [Metabacillus]OAS82060.1 beta-galactosidase [Metabacillus litoralis]QNF29727.1 beta-galactosidase [Metabacillus sp. KUDC1714]
MSNKLYHGAAYYPELWNEEAIENDINLMIEAGINVIRMGEFAWSIIEKEEGKIDVSFFNSMINKLSNHGIETIMCTPTPTPPIWLTHNHPERMYVDADGRVMGHGSRQHVCTNNAYFRERAAIITEEIAKSVGNLPGVIGWQIDNEFKCHVSECMCTTCKTLWHEWLEKRYGTIDELNEAWGTHIWSQHYHQFDQVPQPHPAPFLHNSSLKTMYQLFSYEKIAEFSDEQAAIIRKHSQAPITHNSTTFFHVDNERLYENLDFASFDTYAEQNNFASYLFNCDLWRNFKKGKDFWIMETSPSYSASLENYAVPHPNGYLKAEAVAAYALGAEAFCYWLWRQQRTGCEQPHGSVISAWGKPTVGFENVMEVEKARKEIESVILSTKPIQAEVAITYSDIAKAFIKTEPHKGLDYRSLMIDYYEKILSIGYHRDLIPEQANLNGYKLLFTPFVHYLSPNYISQAEKFVEEGGIWIVGPLSGGRTINHTIHTDAALGELDQLAGVETLFTYPMDGTESIGEFMETSATLGIWSSVFQPKEGKSVGIIKNGLSAGKAFLTENRRGKGKIVMLGSLPIGEQGDFLLKKCFNHYAEEANVTLKTDVSKGTIVAPRQGNGYLVWIIVNMDGMGGTFTLPYDGIDELSNEYISNRECEIEPFQYKIIRFTND